MHESVGGPGTQREIGATQARPAGLMLEFSAPSSDAVRRCVAEQICPFCGRGPFRMLPVHTNKAHGIDKWDLRELAGMSSTETLCSKESTDAMKAASAMNGSPSLAKATEASRRHRRPYRSTTTGRRRNAETLIAWEAAHPDVATLARSAAGRRGGLARWSSQAE